jgi:hypothetical protein
MCQGLVNDELALSSDDSIINIVYEGSSATTKGGDIPSIEWLQRSRQPSRNNKTSIRVCHAGQLCSAKLIVALDQATH